MAQSVRNRYLCKPIETSGPITLVADEKIKTVRLGIWRNPRSNVSTLAVSLSENYLVDN